MKLTKEQLKNIIREELTSVKAAPLKESPADWWDQLEDMLADIMNHSSDPDAAAKAEEAYGLLEKLQGATGGDDSGVERLYAPDDPEGM